MNWPEGKYRVILADPPWSYDVWSAKGTGRSAEQHYQTMKPEDIKALPVRDIADEDCALLMWAVYPSLPLAFEVIESWGFVYKTVGFTWVKTYGANIYLPFVGLGHWTRANAEVVLLATRGKPKRKAKDVEQVILSPVREHSRKPEEQYRRIERLLDGPYCELFARYPRPEWTTWGNENRPRQMDLEEGRRTE